MASAASHIIDEATLIPLDVTLSHLGLAAFTVVQSLANNPYTVGTKKLSGGHHIYRIRIRDYRVIYSVQDDILTVEVIRVGHRKQVYRKG